MLKICSEFASLVVYVFLLTDPTSVMVICMKAKKKKKHFVKIS